ncbi:exonuclease domain-containing protein [Streptacidiphilus jiangxiensis]|uniref:DNA polymerase-3 subunit epsilon n=1 Tax=Streptacidiphilus jiangxiensis TaxID=235985 RepID=A0A1H7ZJ20_STRJI|nr:exonuclease domain-containing protein [Streptacidiphilus jiangxiensis]SEM57489.1 DNA polymerase-3 subunit epsilon [Streptacidiphilus jiangxiensis]
MTLWYEGALASFDTETTGVDVEQDRIVTAALVVQETPGGPLLRRDWVIDPGLPIPAQATAVHGLTDAWAREHGGAPGTAVEAIARALAENARAGRPLVVMNAPYDLTLLDRELRRHRGLTLAQYTSGGSLLVVDPWVLDRHVDRYRKGRRTLTALCEHYGVALTDAHDAAADATAALELSRAIGRRHRGALEGLSAAELHLRQAVWHAAQARGLERWFARSGTPTPVETAWPLRLPLEHAA